MSVVDLVKAYQSDFARMDQYAERPEITNGLSPFSYRLITTNPYDYKVEHMGQVLDFMDSDMGYLGSRIRTFIMELALRRRGMQRVQEPYRNDLWHLLGTSSLRWWENQGLDDIRGDVARLKNRIGTEKMKRLLYEIANEFDKIKGELKPYAGSWRKSKKRFAEAHLSSLSIERHNLGVIVRMF